jgi:protein tyrosine phosphatase (PTP) superfamily phosphohydrolase (DUF442 family)
MRPQSLPTFAAAGIVLFAVSVSAQQVTKETVPGVRNFARLETTVACAGAITPDAVPEIKKMGFVSIINLRVPFNGASPDTRAADQFLAAITSEGAEPAFIHCSGGNRAATMWLIKRVAIDHWDVDRATAEATALGLTSPALKQWALDYAQSHKR